MSQRLLLIDAHGLCYRAFYAVKSLKTSQGEPTNAVFGFCNILRKLLGVCKPSHIAFCFDTGKPTHRQQQFANYKIQRQAMPDDLVSQMKTIRAIVVAYGFLIFEQEGSEADDVMASLSARFASADVKVIIATEDKDMAQLVGAHIQLYSSRQEKMIDQEEVVKKFGVDPCQITDYIALAGDMSDNIPGVKGIGEMTARALITAYKSVEGIYAQIESIPSAATRAKLREGQDNAFLSKTLATVDTQLPLTVSLEDLVFPQPNREALFTLFTALEFRQWAQEYAPAGVSLAQSTQALTRGVVCEDQGRNILIVYDLKSRRKEELGMMAQEDGNIFDVSLADYLLGGGQGQYAMSALWGSEEGLRDLYGIQKRLLKEQGLERLFYDVEMPLVDVLVKMENDGVRLDSIVLKDLSLRCQERMAQLEESVFKIAGVSFNVNSPKQLGEILFERLKLPTGKKLKTGFSTNEEVLTKLASLHPLPALILEYRQIAKYKSTYMDALPLLVDPHGRVHATFNQMGAETGRLSSSNPNLQNIPIRTDLGQQIRKAFVPYAQDHVLLSVDYSQIELRILALLADDEELKKACRDGGDVHRYTASLMFDLPQEDVDLQMRYAAKRINFGIVYGMGAFSLAKDLNVSVPQAQKFIDTYFARYPKVRQFLDGEIQKARTQGYVTTLFGRRRYLPDIHNRNMGLRQFAERQAINAPVQGTAADMIKMAMVHIACQLKSQKLLSTMIMTVHDELVFDVPQDEIPLMISLVRHQMQEVLDGGVSMQVSVKIGKNWLEMKEWRNNEGMGNVQ